MTTDTTNHEPQTAPGVIREVPCYMINCADCGDECWADLDYTPHFTSKADLYRSLFKDHGWTHGRHGRWLCRSCTEEADCARDGHQWGEWRPHHQDVEVVWRLCERCRDHDELLALMLPDLSHAIATATSTGTGQSPTGRVLAVLRDRHQVDGLTAADVVDQAGLDRNVVLSQLLRLRALGLVQYDVADGWRAAA